MTSHHRTSPHLQHGDPAPGDADEWRRTASVLQDVAEQVREANAVLRSMAHATHLWTGPGATAFATTMEGLKARLSSAEQAYTSASEALRGWLITLDALQARAAQVARTADAVAPSAAMPFNTIQHASTPDLERLQHEYDMVRNEAHHAAVRCASALAEAVNVVAQYELRLWDRAVPMIRNLGHDIGAVGRWLLGVSIASAVIPNTGASAFGGLAGSGLTVLGRVASNVLLMRGHEAWDEHRRPNFWETIPAPTAGTPGTAPPAAPVITPPNRDGAEVQAAYDAWATGYWANPNGGQYQCTGWALYRWHELHYNLSLERAWGNGGEMAGNVAAFTGHPPSSQPSVHAMASYSSGGYGHVMIVEDVQNGTIRVSEMNTDPHDPMVGRPEEFSDTKEIKPGPDGKYRPWENGPELMFTAFPGEQHQDQ